MNLDKIQANELAGIAFVEALAVLRIQDVVISPGSRSTPLTYAFSQDSRMHTTVALDERDAGFFALGRTKASGIASVLVCTSGTAAANYLPAVVEARYSHTPLLILTADRPLIEQHCHSPQTILQTGMFSNFVHHEQQLELPQNSANFVRYIREIIRHAISSAENMNGPVHLNVPFEGNLTPVLKPEVYAQAKESVRKRFFNIESAVSLSPANPFQFESSDNRFSDHLTGKRCLCIVGPSYEKGSNESSLGQFIQRLDHLKIPVIVDSLNAARALSKQYNNVIAPYEWLLNPKNGILDSLEPQLIIQVGEIPTSKSLRQAMSNWDSLIITIQPVTDSDNHDPSYSHKIASVSLEKALLECLEIEALPEKPQSNFCQSWIQNANGIRGFLKNYCQENPDWVEPVLCHRLPKLLQQPHDLFISNSMVIRDMENFCLDPSNVEKVFSNRGANGIDGIVSTALGAAREHTPLVCLLGDLSFFHNTGALKLARELKAGCKVLFVLLDNQGGGIFEHLPIASREAVFEKFFATPQTVDITSICNAYGVKYHGGPSELQHLESFFVEWFKETEENQNPSPEVTLLHLKFNRKQSYQYRRRLLKQLCESSS